MSETTLPYAVIGDPVSHSVSPQLHSHLYRHLNMSEQYEAIHVPASRLADFVQASKQHNRPGWNVTLPHKTDIIPLLDEIHPQALRIGAVNTVKNIRGRLIGYNTDVTGCLKALQRCNMDRREYAVILGAGGAARAAAAALDMMEFKRIDIINHNQERAAGLCRDFSDSIQAILTVRPWTREHILQSVQIADLLVNATPVGLPPATHDSPVVRADLLPSTLTVLDMIPAVETSRLIRQAMARGCHIIEGLAMLVAQAIAAQEIWQDRQLPAGCFDITLHQLKEACGCLYEY